MKETEYVKYREMYVKIKHKLNDIQIRMQYGLTNDDKAFLELVNDLLK